MYCAFITHVHRHTHMSICTSQSEQYQVESQEFSAHKVRFSKHPATVFWGPIGNKDYTIKVKKRLYQIPKNHKDLPKK